MESDYAAHLLDTPGESLTFAWGLQHIWNSPTFPQPNDEEMRALEGVVLVMMNDVGPLVVSAENENDVGYALDDAAMLESFEHPAYVPTKETVDFIRESARDHLPADTVARFGTREAARIERGMRLSFAVEDDARLVLASSEDSWAKELIFGRHSLRSVIADLDLPPSLRRVFLSVQRSIPALFAILYINRQSHPAADWLIRSLVSFWYNGRYDAARLMASFGAARRSRMAVPSQDRIDFAAIEMASQERRRAVEDVFHKFERHSESTD